MDFRTQKVIKTLIWIAIVIVLARLLSLPFDVISDPTEGRYSEIGRIMAETGNWITPYLPGGIPFWAKPPLSFWATAASIKVFGANEFGAKLPHLLFLVGAAALMFAFVRKWRGDLIASITLAILTTMVLFNYWMGGVMTDPALVLCLTLGMVSFYNAINGGSRYWGYLFFIAMGLGLLAKGPLIFVLAGLPIFIFVLIKNQWRQLFRNLPIITGTLLMLAIAVPWYLLAERATPGFLEYFFIGEHWQRYLQPNWAGDLYGYGREGFVGKIWLYWLAAITPWSIYFAVRMFSRRFRAAMANAGFLSDSFLFYILCFAATPLLFFTFSKNIIVTYSILALIPTAILLATVVPIDTRKFKWFAVLNLAALIFMCAYPQMKPSEKFIVKQYLDQRPGETWGLYYYDKNPPYSAYFYTKGKVKRTPKEAPLPKASVVLMKDGKLVTVIGDKI